MKIHKHIIVIAHDAGGAEIVSAYVRAHRDQYRFTCFVAGPAMKIFRKKHVAAQLVADHDSFPQLLAAYHDVAFVLAGTGDSGMELNAIRAARSLGIKTIAYLDHWVNYRERFKYPASDWESHLPDEIWVGDQMAKKMADEYFPRTVVRLVPNPFFLEVRRDYAIARRGLPRPKAILFMSEPVPYGESQILEDTLAFFAEHVPGADFIIRFHPRESRNKHDAIIAKHRRGLHIIKSRHPFIVDDLARARVVIGMESVALVAAVLCGKKTASFIPDVTRSLRLPFPQIKLIRSSQGLKILL